jgi:hypothetical protein
VTLLPWEKLPAPALGLILVIFNSIVVSQTAPYSFALIEPVALIILGICLIAGSVRKALAEPDISLSDTLANIERKKNAHLVPPDYSKYSEAELRQILTRIDAERYPERVKEITGRIASFNQ